jgi:hypothetical protein
MRGDMRDPHAVIGRTGFVVNVDNGLYSLKGDIYTVYMYSYWLLRPPPTRRAIAHIDHKRVFGCNLLILKGFFVGHCGSIP